MTSKEGSVVAVAKRERYTVVRLLLCCIAVNLRIWLQKKTASKSRQGDPIKKCKSITQLRLCTSTPVIYTHNLHATIYMENASAAYLFMRAFQSQSCPA